jgi:hypothetical protein
VSWFGGFLVMALLLPFTSGSMLSTIMGAIWMVAFFVTSTRVERWRCPACCNLFFARR